MVYALEQMRNKESNRLEGASKDLSMMIKRHIDFIDKQISHIEDLIKHHISSHSDLSKKQKLLSTIPGIGFKTIIHILAFLGNINKFNSAKQLAAFIGLNPKRYQSGSSVNYRTRLSKTGSPVLRKAFFMPALTAIRYNTLIKVFAERLLQAGKPKKVVVAASMRKLVHIVYGVLKNQTVFQN